jgi:hypothetical protein
MNLYAVLKGSSSKRGKAKAATQVFFPATPMTPPISGSLDDNMTAEQQAAVFAKAQEGTVAGVPVNGASF